VSGSFAQASATTAQECLWTLLAIHTVQVSWRMVFGHRLTAKSSSLTARHTVRRPSDGNRATTSAATLCRKSLVLQADQIWKLLGGQTEFDLKQHKNHISIWKSESLVPSLAGEGKRVDLRATFN